jgi:hypothetical protein
MSMSFELLVSVRPCGKWQLVAWLVPTFHSISPNMDAQISSEIPIRHALQCYSSEYYIIWMKICWNLIHEIDATISGKKKDKLCTIISVLKLVSLYKILIEHNICSCTNEISPSEKSAYLWWHIRRSWLAFDIIRTKPEVRDEGWGRNT